MQTFLAISIDVEPDCTPTWRYSSPLSFQGVYEGIENRLQPLFNKYDMAPTYLINNVVLEDERSCKILRNLKGRFELGTHLHPEYIEPQKTQHQYAGSKAEANCCFLPRDVEFGKLKSITELFRDRFDMNPVSFRAGRFSAGPNTIESLTKLGYKVDTSVTPHVNWSDKTREQPVDYRKANEQPYFIKRGTILESDNTNGTILEVPVTIAMRKTAVFSELKRTYFGLRHKIQRDLPLWLRPVFSNFPQFCSVVEEYKQTHAGNKVIIYNMMFHNVEVMPGLSPYTKTERDCEKYMALLENFFNYCRNNNINGLTLADVYNQFR